jgi:hypothetical protein
MDKWIKIGLKIARPHIFIVVMETFIAFAMLIYSAIYLQPSDMLSIVSYVLSFYALVIVCFRIPDMIKFFKHIRNDNEYVVKYRTDVTIRIKLSLYGTLIFNGAYAGLQLGMGLWHHSVWFYALAGYYLLLAIMRFLLLRHTKEYSPRQNITKELIKYRICGICLLLLNSALTVILFYIIWQNRTFKHHEITTIAMAAYTFTALTFAIVNIIRYRKYQSPVFSSAKAISLACACVSMITLEATMLTTFGTNEGQRFRQIMMASSGGVISMFIVGMAIYMIVNGTKKLKENNNGK